MRPLVACAAALMLACAPRRGGRSPARRPAILLPLLALTSVQACGSSTPLPAVVQARAAAAPNPTIACSDDRVRDAFGARVSLVGRVVARDSAIAVSSAFTDAMYEALANRRVRVERLEAPESARVEFTVERSGAMGDTILPRYTGPVWFAEDVLGTLASAVLTRSIPALPRGIDAERLPLALEIRAGSPRPGWRPFPLRIALDTAMIHETAIAQPGNRAPRYPDNLRYRGINGDVLIQLIVDPNGRADMSSITPEHVTAPEFLDAVVEQLRSFRYYPATLDGCAVPAWVSQPFAFRVGSGPPQ